MNRCPGCGYDYPNGCDGCCEYRHPMPEWISVKERFPTKDEHNARILVYFDDCDLMGIQPSYAPIGPCEPYEYSGPSHWMPAPKPPEILGKSNENGH